jgi:hypothetical protein
MYTGRSGTMHGAKKDNTPDPKTTIGKNAPLSIILPPFIVRYICIID